MKSHRNLHRLLGIENSEVMSQEHIPYGEGMYSYGSGMFASGGGLYASGRGLYVSPPTGHGLYGGKVSKIGKAFEKAFKPLVHSAEHTGQVIKTGFNQKVIPQAIKIGDSIKTGVVKTYNQAHTAVDSEAQKIQTGFNQKVLPSLETVGRYVIPATTSALGGLAGTLATGGNPVAGIAGSAAGAYAGYKLDKALGIANKNDFPSGKGMKRGCMKGGNLKETLNEKVWKKIPKAFHKPLEDIGVASLEYAGFKIPPRKKLQQEDKKIEQGTGFKKGSKSKTRKGEIDFMTHKGDKDFHRGGKDETESESDSDSDNEMSGGKLKRTRHKKGSPEALEWGRKMREARQRKMSGKGISNNSPQSNAIRVSPYQNF